MKFSEKLWGMGRARVAPGTICAAPVARSCSNGLSPRRSGGAVSTSPGRMALWPGMFSAAGVSGAAVSTWAKSAWATAGASPAVLAPHGPGDVQVGVCQLRGACPGAGRASSRKRQKGLARRICSGVRQSGVRRVGLATIAATQRAREVATLRRCRL